ncbi:MAG: LVIVD repeat-containing protein [Planctomycetota bacterium]
MRAVSVQFRYAFIACEGGFLSLDVTPEPDGSFPYEPSVVSMIALEDARQVYVARTYAYVAAGKQGLAIVDVTRPTEMKLVQLFDHRGSISDCNDVKIGITNTSLFAYLADGRNGLRVVQLTDPATDDRNFGFSPQPNPRVIATFRTQGRALSLSRGLDRDRAVDESGNQIAAFNRVGARPFTFAEMLRLYRLPDGELFTVVDLHEDADVRREYGTPTSPPR